MFVVGFPADLKSSRWVYRDSCVCSWLMTLAPRPAYPAPGYPTVVREPVQTRFASSDLISYVQLTVTTLLVASRPAGLETRKAEPASASSRRICDRSHIYYHYAGLLWPPLGVATSSAIFSSVGSFIGCQPLLEMDFDGSGF